MFSIAKYIETGVITNVFLSFRSKYAEYDQNCAGYVHKLICGYFDKNQNYVGNAFEYTQCLLYMYVLSIYFKTGENRFKSELMLSSLINNKVKLAN